MLSRMPTNKPRVSIANGSPTIPPPIIVLTIASDPPVAVSPSLCCKDGRTEPYPTIWLFLVLNYFTVWRNGASSSSNASSPVKTRDARSSILN